MSDKKLVVLGIITLAVVVLAILQSRYSRTYTPPQITLAPLIEGLDIDQVQAIEIKAKDAQPIRLRRKDTSFVVATKEDYPANLKKINSLISDCLDIRITSDALITANPENHAHLRLTPDTARYEITFLDGQDKALVGLLIAEADREDNTSSAAVRLAASNQAWRLTETPYISTRPMDYIDAQILQIDRQKIVRVTVTDPNQTSYTLTPVPDSTDVKLAELPPQKQVRQSNARSTFNSLTSLRMEDVLTAASAPPLEFNQSYVCELDDHLVYTLRMARSGQKNYIRLSARYTGPEPQVQQQVESEELLRQREALFVARDTAETFTAKHSGWIYIIPSYKSEEMTRSLADLIEDIPQPAAASEDTSAPGTPATSAP
jgi:hypothetical protein